MTNNELLHSMRDALRDISDTVDWDTVEEHHNLAVDLGFDSLMMMLVSIKIEDAFGVEIADDAQFVTVGDVIAYIQQRV